MCQRKLPGRYSPTYFPLDSSNWGSKIKYTLDREDEILSNLRGFKLYRLFFGFSVSLVLVATLSSQGYCVRWINVCRNENYTEYYNSASLKIDKKKKIINVWVKRVYTQKGKIDFLKHVKGEDKQKYIDVSRSLGLWLLNYKGWKYDLSQLTLYSKSGSVLFSEKRSLKWEDIIPGSDIEKLTKRILKDYKIKG